ncbi:MAG: flagellar basal body L-ring protein FlgH [Bdellovibrionaceae bacterium]|nr:flagellar basal body L-ring protein FlgH [Bdellovibrionales bacterium]MCB9084883.1 flagellar basal body L-ring protein FlgH [Pseudobdellovibrionaceae bacterium]
MKRRSPVLSLLKLTSIALLTLSLVGCAGFGKKMKAFLGGGGGAAEAAAPPKPQYTKFSDNSNLYNNVRRQYKRATKQSLQEEAQLEGHAGSLWIMEGQGSYLFSQNIIRMIGDPMSVRIDGEPRDQLQSKVTVIRKLLAKLERRAEPPPVRDPAAAPAAPGAAKPPGAPAPKEAGKEEDSKSDVLNAGSDFPVKTVPTRITERMIDGNYRVRGSQPFMIGSREYKVIVTGIVRSEDFSDEGISSSSLLDPKFDIVSVKRKSE